MLAQGYTFLFNLDAQLLFDTVLLAVAVFFLFMLMSYLLFNPARKLLKDRQDRIESDINTAVADKESAAALKAEYEGKLKDIDKEAEFGMTNTKYPPPFPSVTRVLNTLSYGSFNISAMVIPSINSLHS